MIKASNFFKRFCFKIGETIFPIVEPIFKLAENKNPEVRMHFNRALMNLNQRKQTIALLNLNMVLSLKPDHFRARIFRGRIYVKEGQYRLASEDYLEASRISQYRFIHYDLYQEYFKSLNKEFGEQGVTISEKIDDVFDIMHYISGGKYLEPTANQEFQESLFLTKKKDTLPQDLALTPEEKEKFEILGPISQHEIEEIDWDLLMDYLKS